MIFFKPTKQQMLDEIRDKLIELLINYINGIRQAGFDVASNKKRTDAYINIGMQQYVLIELHKDVNVLCGLDKPHMPAKTYWMEYARENKEKYVSNNGSVDYNDEWEYAMIETHMKTIDNILTDLAKIL